MIAEGSLELLPRCFRGHGERPGNTTIKTVPLLEIPPR